MPCSDNKHQFEPRFDEDAPKIPPEWRFHDLVKTEAFRKKTYVCDVCIVCGKIVEPARAARD